MTSICTIRLVVIVVFILLHCKSRCGEATSSEIDALQEENFCPVSAAAINRNVHHAEAETFFTYPSDIYFSSSLKASASDPSYQCTYSEAFELIKVDRCFPTLQTCPLIADNVRTAAVSDFSESHACGLPSEERPSQVIVLGGSVTTGVSASGCCCSEEIEPKCAGQKNALCMTQTDSRVPSTLCSWVGYFHPFLSSLSSHFHVHNLAVGGHMSHQMMAELAHRLKQLEITLTSADIVFIDHSVNDAFGGTPETIQQGVEALIREILLLSKGSWPTIILLEMWPFPSKQFLDSYTVTEANKDLDYSTAYRRIASHYNVSVWSYKDVIWSPEATAKQSHLLPYLRFHNNLVDKHNRNWKNHPPWHVHVFYADLLGSLFLRKFVTACSPSTQLYAPSLIHYSLPSALSQREEVICDDSVPSYIYMDFTQPQLLIDAEKLELSPAGSWMHKEDRPNKFGMVSYFTPQDQERHSLKIPLNRTALTNSANPDALLVFTFLKTYLNAGVVEVGICGEYIVFLEALWRFPDITRYSFPESQNLIVKVGDILNKYCNHESEPYVYLDHFFHYDKSDDVKTARTPEQKFRLDAVEVCIPKVISVSL